MNPLVSALILLLAVSLAMAFGVATGYLIIAGILNAFAHKPATSQSEMAPAHTGVAGD